MARAPLIDSPCPIANRPLPAGASDHCTQCDRTVHNLDRLNERERVEFMRGCSGQVCVAYTKRVPVSVLRPRGLAAATLAAAALVSLPAAATDAMSPVPPDAREFPHCEEDLSEVVVTGGVLQGNQAEWEDDGKDAPPELPTIEDDGR
jgi:hypothetical protein